MHDLWKWGVAPKFKLYITYVEKKMMTGENLNFLSQSRKNGPFEVYRKFIIIWY